MCGLRCSSGHSSQYLVARHLLLFGRFDGSKIKPVGVRFLEVFVKLHSHPQPLFYCRQGVRGPRLRYSRPRHIHDGYSPSIFRQAESPSFLPPPTQHLGKMVPQLRLTWPSCLTLRLSFLLLFCFSYAAGVFAS
jgi:hypothetical protein